MNRVLVRQVCLVFVDVMTLVSASIAPAKAQTFPPLESNAQTQINSCEEPRLRSVRIWSYGLLILPAPAIV